MDLNWCCLLESCFQTQPYYSELPSFKILSMIWWRQECLSICCGLVLLKKLIETSLRVSHSVLRLCGKGFEEEELLLFCGRQALKRWCWWWMGSFWLWWLLKLRQIKDDLPMMMIRMLYCIIIINVPHKMTNDYKCAKKPNYQLWWEGCFLV